VTPPTPSPLHQLLELFNPLSAVRASAGPWLTFLQAHRLFALELELAGETKQAAAELANAAGAEKRAIKHLRTIAQRAEDPMAEKPGVSFSEDEVTWLHTVVHVLLRNGDARVLGRAAATRTIARKVEVMRSRLTVLRGKSERAKGIH
jgi:hypothetical protein